MSTREDYFIKHHSGVMDYSLIFKGDNFKISNSLFRPSLLLKGTATLMITMFYMKDLNRPRILIPVSSKLVENCGSYWRLNICKWTVMEAAIV